MLTPRVPLSSTGYLQASFINLVQIKTPWAAGTHHRGDEQMPMGEGKSKSWMEQCFLLSPRLSYSFYPPHCSLFRSSSGQNHLISFTAFAGSTVRVGGETSPSPASPVQGGFPRSSISIAVLPPSLFPQITVPISPLIFSSAWLMAEAKHELALTCY